jgi:exodeoxyribonuclease VII small subunit
MTEKNISFEQAIQELEQIVREMESGQAKLEESLEKYEQGIKLAKICEERLSKAKTKLQEISVNEDGSIKKAK